MAKIYCPIGREQYSPAHATCVSCRKAGEPCPFGAPVEKAPLKTEISKPGKKGPTRKGKGPNKTELECKHRLALEYPGAEIRYEPISLIIDLDGELFGYKADWGVIFPDGRILLVEVKNAAYQHASYGRSRMAFAAARVTWPMFSYRWAEKDKGAWRITDY